MIWQVELEHLQAPFKFAWHFILNHPSYCSFPWICSFSGLMDSCLMHIPLSIYSKIGITHTQISGALSLYSFLLSSDLLHKCQLLSSLNLKYVPCHCLFSICENSHFIYFFKIFYHWKVITVPFLPFWPKMEVRSKFGLFILSA